MTTTVHRAWVVDGYVVRPEDDAHPTATLNGPAAVAAPHPGT